MIRKIRKMNWHKERLSQAMRYGLFYSGVWTLGIFVTLLWHSRAIMDQSIASLNMRAKESFEKDLIIRQWSLLHGGVYVPVTPETPPNPYLAQLPNRDIETTSGQKLTLINPGYMTRQLHELGKKRFGSKSHMASLNPINPKNSPDEWERGALLAFQNGAAEVGEVAAMGGVPCFRFMRPLATEKRCLFCHEKDGHRPGEIRCGISVAIPISYYWEEMGNHIVSVYMGYGAIWVMGLFGIALGTRKLSAYIGHIRKTEETLRDGEEKYRTMMESIGDLVYICSDDFRIKYVNPAMAAKMGRCDINARCHEAIYHLKAPCSWCAFDRLKQGEQVVYELYHPVDHRYYSIMNTPLLKNDGAIWKMTISRDITEIKQMGAMLLQTEKMASIGQLAAGIAHEINNPIGFISSNLKMFSDYEKNLADLVGQYRKFAASLKEEGSETQHLDALLGAILANEKEMDIDFIMKDLTNLISESREGADRIKEIINNIKYFLIVSDLGEHYDTITKYRR